MQVNHFLQFDFYFAPPQTESEQQHHEDQNMVSLMSEDFAPTIALTSLFKILRDATLSSVHSLAIAAIMFIVRSLGVKFVKFLPKLMPLFVQVLRNEQALREYMFQQLSVIVSVAQRHISPYLPSIFELIEEYWLPPNQMQIIALIEELSISAPIELKGHMPSLISPMISVLNPAALDKPATREAAKSLLHLLDVLGTNLEDYLHLVMPAVLKVFENEEISSTLRVAAAQTVGRLAKRLNFSRDASRIIHPIVRVLCQEGVNATSELKEAALDTLCVVAFQLGPNFSVFIPLCEHTLSRQKLEHRRLDGILLRLQKNETLLDDEVRDLFAEVKDEQAPVDIGGMKKLRTNTVTLQRAWDSSQCSTREDWNEWLRRFSIELLRESPSPALRACLSLAQEHSPVVQKLFDPAFASCWSELPDPAKEDFLKCFTRALTSPSIPLEVTQRLLNLAEFMEHGERPLPLDNQLLGDLAENCHAFAKALHYKEQLFGVNPTGAAEALISINTLLDQPEAAIGILRYAQSAHNIELKESWYEKLGRWEEALGVYELKLHENPVHAESIVGRVRCLAALSESEKLAAFCREKWVVLDTPARRSIAPLAAEALWVLGRWDSIMPYIEVMEENSVQGSFFRSILALNLGDYGRALSLIDQARGLSEAELTTLVGESYLRGYNVAVRMQQFSELEEVIEYRQATPARCDAIKRAWRKRLLGAQRSIPVWQRLLSVHSLVLTPNENQEMLLKFASLCADQGRLALAQRTLLTLSEQQNDAMLLLQHSPALANVDKKLAFAMLKHLWVSRPAQQLRDVREQLAHFAQRVQEPHLLARVHLKLAEWNLQLRDNQLSADIIPALVVDLRKAVHSDPSWAKAWHMWGLVNFQVISYYEVHGRPEQLSAYLLPALTGLFRSVAFDHRHTFEDLLRVLTLWFRHGSSSDVKRALLDGFETISADTWLQVIPQLIARIHTPVHAVRKLLHELVDRIGKKHPQALVLPLTVASKSHSQPRVKASTELTERLCEHSQQLVDQALLVSQQLIEVSIAWHESWREALYDASKLYFSEHDTEGMLALLRPLHEQLERGPQTNNEHAFVQLYGRDLNEANEWCRKYARSKKAADLNHAWDLYGLVYRRIEKQLPQITSLEMANVSPILAKLNNLELCVPGTYRANEELVRISSFVSSITVILSKQRPRRLCIKGSDGREYQFLLKGHEDLRQDERVMQLFALLNTLLSTNPFTQKQQLSIHRFPVIPLSPNSGLIGWIPHSDTFHQLIRDYRSTQKTPLDLEHQLMKQITPKYEELPLLQRLEVFQFALEQTQGMDLSRVLWLKSRNSEVWLERRTNYTRSLAVMSMVGYILGLGDRHPSNLMMDRHTGRVVHIDFGDCKT